MSLPKRKKLRLKNYDYSSQGCYFITISTHERKKLFWENNELSKFGEIAEKYILMIPEKYFGIKIDNYAIMPDHIHLLITIGCDALPNDDETLHCSFNGSLVFKNIPVIISSLKGVISKEIRKEYPGIEIWQKSYYDHIIKNMNDYNETWDYIENNPNVYLAKNNNRRERVSPVPQE